MNRRNRGVNASGKLQMRWVLTSILMLTALTASIGTSSAQILRDTLLVLGDAPEVPAVDAEFPDTSKVFTVDATMLLPATAYTHALWMKVEPAWSEMDAPGSYDDTNLGDIDSLYWSCATDTYRTRLWPTYQETGGTGTHATYTINPDTITFQDSTWRRFKLFHPDSSYYTDLLSSSAFDGRIGGANVPLRLWFHYVDNGGGDTVRVITHIANRKLEE